MISISLTRVGAAAAVALALFIGTGAARADGPAADPVRTAAVEVAAPAPDGRDIAKVRVAAALREDAEALFTPVPASVFSSDCTDACAIEFHYCMEIWGPRVCLPELRRCLEQCGH
jgi:hypothetical protein